MIDPRYIADIVRDPEDPRFEDAWQALKRIFWPITETSRYHGLLTGWEGDLEARKHELLHELWLYLVENPHKLESKRILGRGAMETEIRRFLNRQASGRESGHVQRMKHHLWKKANATLRDSASFRSVGQRLWLLANQELTCPFRPRTDKDLCALLPSLPSMMKSQRSGQLPPLVTQQELGPFLERVLHEAEYPCTTHRLSTITWAKLEPSPEAVTLSDEQSTTPTDRGDRASEDWYADSSFDDSILLRWGARIETLASGFLDEIDSSVARIVVMHFRSPTEETYRSLAVGAGVSHGTVGNRIQTFQDEFAQLVREQGLSERQAEQLLHVVLDRLEVEHFLKDEEVFVP